MNIEYLIKKKNNILFYLILIVIIIFGIFLRLKGFLSNPSFWHDECGMAWNIKFKSYSQLFGVLRFLQVTPPLFSVLTKFLVGILGYSEKVFRLIPFLTGCLSIIAFYFLSLKVLNKKISVIIAVLIFAINQQLINFSFEFKPYESDVFLTIVALLFFIKVDIERLKITKALIYGVLTSLLPWFSFASVFSIVAGVLNLIFKTLKNKNKNPLAISCFLLPILVSALIYLKLFVLGNYSGTSMVSGWQNYFVSLNPLKNLYLLNNSFRYLFFPVQNILFALIFFVLGIYLFIKEKSVEFRVLFLSFILFLTASLLKIYPFGDRVILFLIPSYLLFILKPLDLICFNRKIKSVVILLMVSALFYPQIVSAGSFLRYKGIDKGEYPREMLETLINSIKKDETIVVNKASNTEFYYYSSFYNIKNLVIYENLTDKSNEEYANFLNNLKKGYYWFYLPFDYSHKPVTPMILSWAKTKKIIYSFQKNKSVLLYVQMQ